MCHGLVHIGDVELAYRRVVDGVDGRIGYNLRERERWVAPQVAAVLVLPFFEYVAIAMRGGEGRIFSVLYVDDIAVLAAVVAFGCGVGVCHRDFMRHDRLRVVDNVFDGPRLRIDLTAGDVFVRADLDLVGDLPAGIFLEQESVCGPSCAGDQLIPAVVVLVECIEDVAHIRFLGCAGGRDFQLVVDEPIAVIDGGVIALGGLDGRRFDRLGFFFGHRYLDADRL